MATPPLDHLGTEYTSVSSVSTVLSAGTTTMIAYAAEALSLAAIIASGYVGLVAKRLEAHNKKCNLTLRLYTKGAKKGTFKVYEEFKHV